MTTNTGNTNHIQQPPPRLKPLRYLCEVLPDTNYQRAARLVREILPDGSDGRPAVVVRLGRQIFIHVDNLADFISAGGAALPGRWRKEPTR